MDTGKIYHDGEGKECSIMQMVRREPEWAANRVQEGEKAIERLAELAKKPHSWPPWRPEDEGQPRVNDCVLVTVEDPDDDYRIVEFAEYNPKRPKGRRWMLVGGSGPLEGVLAWMPTPPPYDG